MNRGESGMPVPDYPALADYEESSGRFMRVTTIDFIRHSTD